MHPQSEVNQKELPQLKKYFTKKQRVSRQKSFNLLPSKILVQIMYVHIVCNTKSLENMFNKCIMTQCQLFSILWQKAGHVEIYIVLINTTSQVR